MRLIADSNVLFAAFMSGSQKYLTIFRKADIYIPDFALREIEKYESRIVQKTKLVDDTLMPFTRSLFSQITVIPKLAISSESTDKAYKLCADIDEKDTLFVALSIELSMPLWTNDQRLTEGLQEKGYTDLYGSNEIFELLL